MMKHKNGGMSPWGAGLGLLSLLMGVALMMYLWSQSASVTMFTPGNGEQALKHAQEQLDRINQAATRPLEEQASGVHVNPPPAAASPAPLKAAGPAANGASKGER